MPPTRHRLPDPRAREGRSDSQAGRQIRQPGREADPTAKQGAVSVPDRTVDVASGCTGDQMSTSDATRCIAADDASTGIRGRCVLPQPSLTSLSQVRRAAAKLDEPARSTMTRTPAATSTRAAGGAGLAPHRAWHGPGPARRLARSSSSPMARPWAAIRWLASWPRPTCSASASWAPATSEVSWDLLPDVAG